MPRKRCSPEEIVAELQRADALTFEGKSMAAAVKAPGVTETRFCR